MPTKNITVGGAILVGHLVITFPALCIWFIMLLIFLSFNVAFNLGVLFGAAFAWAYWSFVTPRWRYWAIEHGADPDKLSKWGMLTLLTFKKGSIFERTEFKYTPKEKRSGQD